MGLPKPTPEQFRRVPDGKKLDLLVKHFLTTCTDKVVFVKNKSGAYRPCKDYFGIKNFWAKESVADLLYLYDYLFSLPEGSMMTFTEFFDKAKAYRKTLVERENRRKVAALKVEKQEEISLEDVLNL